MARTKPRYGATVKIGAYRVLAAYLSFAAHLLRTIGGQKQELRRLETAVITATSQTDNTGMPRRPGPSDPTPAAALRLDDSSDPTFMARAHLRMLVRSVQDAYDHLPVDEHEILRDLYVQPCKTLLGVARDQHMSLATVNRRRNQALMKIAVAVIGEQILMPARR